MVAAEWSLQVETLLKEKRVARVQSKTLALVSKNSIAPECSQIQPFSS